VPHFFSYPRLSALSANSPYAFSTFHHLKRFRKGRQKIAEFIERICREENINSFPHNHKKMLENGEVIE
jgi:hypothetical protein